MINLTLRPLIELFYTKKKAKKEIFAGVVLDAFTVPIAIDEMPHSFSWEEKPTKDHEIKIKMQGVDRPLAKMQKLYETSLVVNWRITSDTYSWEFSGFVYLIEDGFVDGIFESNYLIRGFNKIKVQNGATPREREHNNKNLRPLRRKKSSVATQDALRSKRNRARVRKTNLVQLPVGSKKRVRGPNAAPVRDRKPSRKQNGGKP